MKQTELEKSERRRIRKKNRRLAAGCIPTTQPEVFTGYKTSTEFRENTRLGVKSLWDNKRDTMMKSRTNPAFIARASAAASLRWDTPGSRELAAQNMIAFYSSPDNRKRHSENMLLALDNPEFRAKCSQRVGPLAANWRGGISFEPYCHKFNDDFRRNVRHFFDHKCILCLYEGIETPEQKRLLNVHHVHYDKGSLCNEDSPRMFATLCDSHHGMTNGDREFWGALLEEIITTVYNGQSYYCEEEWTRIKADLGRVELVDSLEISAEA